MIIAIVKNMQYNENNYYQYLLRFTLATMSGGIVKVVQQLERLVYLASGLLCLVLLYLWSVLAYGVSEQETVVLTTSNAPLFHFAQHHVYHLKSGLIAQVHMGQLGYVFSQQEWQWLNGLLRASQFLLYGVLVICAWAMRYAPLRRFALSMALMAAVLLYSPLFGLSEHATIPPWWTLFLVLVPTLAVYFDVRKRLPLLSGQRTTLIAYASQTGSAKRLAEQLYGAAHSLMDMRCVSQLSAQQLTSYERVLFVVSTHGNGAAPDTAHTLLKELRFSDAAPTHTKFSVLALGDRTYQTFCAFGYQLADLLAEKGFQRELPTQAVDRMDGSTVASWWQQVCTRMGLHTSAITLTYDEFEVLENECLNPSQPQRLAHRIRLYRAGVSYRAGDVLAVQPQTASGPAPERLYSIASCEADYVELLVRQHWRADHSLGVASGYLTQLQPGQRVNASVRAHASFHLVEDVPLIMIGAGTGLAPFIGFLQQKAQWATATENWLIFGEQYAECNAYFASSLQQFQASGVLTRFDTAWSRSEGRYVQTLLSMHALTLREWVEHKGAHVYVCGSRQGFGEAVTDSLRAILPAAYLTQRLHTDLY